MSFWEMLALVSTMTTILGVFLTIYAMINNKTLKEESRHTREILNRMEQGQKEIAEKQNATLARMEQGQKEIAEKQNATLARMEEGQRESTKYLAHLIVTEGEKTREEVGGHSL